LQLLELRGVSEASHRTGSISDFKVDFFPIRRRRRRTGKWVFSCK
jgi:hypothetical protein